ncbi:RNAse E [Profundibacterium mesophilum KAUST100406-0324]|uniref:Ribonuclease E n=2 Tax=Profundibacterium TaxID=1258570 RepID=A0A921P0U7_9RHOB|nr:RNAse E [Profundibacterium mesophilum KAUST100406-0324]
MLIDATHAEETRVVVVDGNKVEEFDFESENKRQLAGNIYLAKVTRVEPSLQAAFVDYGGNRHGFLAFSEVHPDYYQIPVADREALLAEEAAYAKSLEDEDEKPKRRSRTRRKSEKTVSDDQTDSAPADEEGTPASAEEADLEAAARTAAIVSDIPGMAVVDLAESDDDEDEDAGEGRDDDGGRQDASARDADIESVADDDVSDEVRRPRKPRARKYKIQEVIKVRQILLVQVVKEERGNKGAALTTYLSLAGRYCVLMPNTARGGGISRKITNAADRKKLKEIAQTIEVPQGAGLIVRTAGAKRTKTEIKRDYEYLQRMWEQIRELTLRSIAPAPIYEEGNLIKRSIRDLYNRDIDEVLVEGAEGYRTAKDFMKMIMPSHAKNVKHYQDQMPLFARHQVESYLSGMFNPTVQLKSGGYIVIGVTEALVAIDVNSGRATKEGSIEDTALKTNLEAAEEVARQLRLRDLAGLIVIDFIDMDERKNNAAVEKLFKDKLKTDRARIQVGRISGFGLLEMSRQRLRPGMIEATTQPCSHCHGTGLLRSDDNLSLNILRQLEEEGVRKRTREVLVKAPVAIANYLMNHKREHIAQIEARYGMAVRVEGDPTLVSPDFTVEKFKTQTGRVVEQTAPVISGGAALMADVDEAETVDPDEAPEAASTEVETPEQDDTDTETRTDAAPRGEDAEGDGQNKKRRRRRRRRKGNGNGDGPASQSAEPNGQAGSQASEGETAPAQSGDAGTDAAPAETGEAAAPQEAETAEDTGEGNAARKPRRSRSRSRKRAEQDNGDGQGGAEKIAERVAADAPIAPPSPQDGPVPREATVAQIAQASEAEQPATPAAAEPASTTAPASEQQQEAAPVRDDAEPANADAANEGADDRPEAANDEGEANPPKRRGWWSLGR